MLRIFANDINPPLAADDFTIFTKFFHTSSNLHDNPPKLTDLRWCYKDWRILERSERNAQSLHIFLTLARTFTLNSVNVSIVSMASMVEFIDTSERSER